MCGVILPGLGADQICILKWWSGVIYVCDVEIKVSMAGCQRFLQNENICHGEEL